MLYVVIGTFERQLFTRMKDVLDSTCCWYRVDAVNTWFICTTESAETWATRLRPLAGADGRVIVCRVDPSDRQGWMTQDFWDWLAKHSAHQSETRPTEPEPANA